MNKVSFFAELLERLRTESPDFFKKLQNALVIIGFVLEALVWLNELWPFPEAIQPLIGHGPAISAFLIALVAKSAVKDKEELDKKLEEKLKK